VSRLRRPRSLIAALLVASLVAGCAGATVPPSLAPTTARPAEPTSDPALGGEAPATSLPAVTVTPATPATPAPTATPAPVTPAPVTPDPSLPPPEPFAIDLYERGDYVAQYTFEWCVGASIQMTLAMMDRTADMGRAHQQRLWEMARDRSASPFGGANPIGWVATLNELGVGPYQLVSEPNLDSALRRGAAALVSTGRPVGLVMWHGRHAWMMSGFESLGDPRARPDFQVTGVRVLDPLHPHGSRAWGPSPAPNALLAPEVLGEQFVARLGGRVDLKVVPGYLLVLPTLA